MKPRIITPFSRWWIPPVRSVWEKRELFLLFVKRQCTVRYQQSILGVLWAVLNPLGTLFVFWLLFSKMLQVPTDGYPYIIYAFAGLIPWNAFNQSANATMVCLQEEMGIISKVYFPRIILPLVNLTRVMFDSLIVLVLLIIVAALYGYMPTWRFLLLPAVLLFSLIVGMSFGLPFAGPVVRFRDLRVPFSYSLQLLMYLTPVIYAPTIIPERFQWLLELNPMYWVIQFSRWCLLKQELIFSSRLSMSLGIVGLLLLCGWLVFAYTERRIIDVQ